MYPILSHWFALSNIGARQHNEDAWAANSAVSVENGTWNIWAVADGLGGHEGGQVAARLAVEAATSPALMSEADPAAVVDKAIRAAQNAVLAEINKSGHYDMSTTLVVLASWQGHIAWGHVGDSRVYRFRDGKHELLTRDHSLAWALALSEGRDIGDLRTMAERNQLISVLGQAEPRIEVGSAVEIVRGDRYLLCTDGWWEPVTEPIMANCLAVNTEPEEWLRCMNAHIAVVNNTEQDNHTALAVFFD